MNLISGNKENFIEKCKIYILKKMHQKSNYLFVWTSGRANQTNQKFYINLINNKEIVLIFKNKRYPIIFVNNFLNYI